MAVNYRQFKWDILGDAADEDYQMLYEPLGWARTQWPDMPDAERQVVAERVLRELYTEGLIFFFHAPSMHEMDDFRQSDVVDPARVLSTAEVNAVLAGDEWRTVPLGRAGVDVWFGATAQGEAAVGAAPDDIKRYWRGEEGRRRNDGRR